jgi:hypothetical protein
MPVTFTRSTLSDDTRDAAMRRSPVLLLVCLLLLATGLGLVGVGATLSLPDVPARAGASAKNLTIARAYYAAVDTMLATGKEDALNAMVDPDLTTHPTPADGVDGRTGLVRFLLARRSVFPGLRLVVDDVWDTGDDLVTARIHSAGATAGDYLGLPLPVSLASFGPIEILRVDGEKIVERWIGEETVLIQQFGRAGLVVSGSAPWFRSLSVTRLSFDAGTRVAIENGVASRFILIEAGTLTANFSAMFKDGASVAIASEGTWRLSAGELLSTAPNAAYTLVNDTGARAGAIVVTVFGNGGGPSPDFILASAANDAGARAAAPAVIASSTVAVMPGAAVPTGSTLGIGRITVPRELDLALPAAPGTLLAAIETGAVSLNTFGGEARGYYANYRPWAGTSALLSQGDGAAVGAGAGGLWHTADGPSVLLILVITPPTADIPWSNPNESGTPLAPRPDCPRPGCP